jgi:hypothetical protein
MLSYNSLVKKILLTLVGVVGLSGVSWGNSLFPNSQWVVNGISFDYSEFPNSGLWSGMDIDGAYHNSQEHYPPNALYSYSGVDIMNNNGNYEVLVRISKEAMSGDVESLSFIFKGSSLDNLVLDPTSINLHIYNNYGDISEPEVISSHNIDSGSFGLSMLLSPVAVGMVTEMFPLAFNAGGDEPEATAGAFVEQAQELNVGLVFQDGQWAPAE